MDDFRRAQQRPGAPRGVGVGQGREPPGVVPDRSCDRRKGRLAGGAIGVAEAVAIAVLGRELVDMGADLRHVVPERVEEVRRGQEPPGQVQGGE